MLVIMLEGIHHYMMISPMKRILQVSVPGDHLRGFSCQDVLFYTTIDCWLSNVIIKQFWAKFDTCSGKENFSFFVIGPSSLLLETRLDFSI